MTEPLIWPAAERNKGPILDVLSDVLPDRGSVLEIASGTGQQVVHFAQSLSGLQWQPSDPDPRHRESISAAVDERLLSNVMPPLDLDVCGNDWPAGPFTAVLAANLLHIAPVEVLDGLFRCARAVLDPTGMLLVYGPFKSKGRFNSPGDEAFDASLRERNPGWGIRDLEVVIQSARDHEFQHVKTFNMPANNLLLRFDGLLAGAEST